MDLANTLHQHAVAEIEGPNWLSGRYHRAMQEEAKQLADGLKGALERGSRDEILRYARLLLDSFHQALLMGAWHGAMNKAVRSTIQRAARAYGYRQPLIH